MTYDNKLVLITGAALRVGKYLAQKLAYDGWKIALHYHNSEKEAYKLAQELLPLSDIMLFKADLSKADEVDSLIHEVKKQMGEITLMVNSASIYKNDKLTNLTPANLSQNLNLHLAAPLYLARAMTSGNIINIIDADVVHYTHKFFSYNLSKKALLELTKMMAYSLAPDVRVNAIAPGPLLFKDGQDQELFNNLVKESPLKTKAELDDLYHTLMFLVNIPSITGQCIFLDGGRHLL